MTTDGDALPDENTASIYELGGTWTDQEGRPTMLTAFGGDPVIISMVFTHCSYACPLTIHDMKQFGSQLPADLQDRVRYVLVSLDSERDTPARLRQFAEGYGLDLRRWTLLRGEAEDVRTLAALLGVRYREQADGQFAHTSILTALGERGEILVQQKGLGGDVASAAEEFRDLLAAVR